MSQGISGTESPTSVACTPGGGAWTRPAVRRDEFLIVDDDAFGTLYAVAAFVRDWQAAEFPHADVLEFEFFTDGRTVTLLECYASEAAHQRHFARWATGFAGRMSKVLVLKDIHIYGRGISAVPRDWEPFMSTLENPLERNHKGPVGKL